MTLVEMKQTLEREGISPLAYCLHGGLPNEAYTIEFRDGVWSVYYSERGQRRSQQTFNSESDACIELLRQLRADSMTRR